MSSPLVATSIGSANGDMQLAHSSSDCETLPTSVSLCAGIFIGDSVKSTNSSTSSEDFPILFLSGDSVKSMKLLPSSGFFHFSLGSVNSGNLGSCLNFTVSAI